MKCASLIFITHEKFQAGEKNITLGKPPSL